MGRKPEPNIFRTFTKYSVFTNILNLIAWLTIMKNKKCFYKVSLNCLCLLSLVWLRPNLLLCNGINYCSTTLIKLTLSIKCFCNNKYEWHSAWQCSAIMLSVTFYLLYCCMSLCWMSLCWMSLSWMSLCRMSLCWMSLCWMSLCWMSLCCRMSLCWMSLYWVSCRLNYIRKKC